MSRVSEGARAAVAGSPISHSRSPLLHSRAYELLGLRIDYGRIEAGAKDAASLAVRLRSEPGWLGLSATMPLKQPLLEHMDSVSPTAQALGAMNTVVVHHGPRGVELHGENTDVQGIVGAFRAAGCAPVQGYGLILGGGGTAASAIAALARLGLGRAVIAVRRPEAAAALRELGGECGIDVDVTSLTNVTTLAPAELVVSTLPPHAADEWAQPVSRLARPGVLLLDVAYDPWPSALGAAWEAKGGSVIHGLSMLVHQAVEQIALFTGDERATEDRIVEALCDVADITPEGHSL